MRYDYDITLSIDGHLLNLLEKNNGRLNPDLITRVVLDVCSALSFLHTQRPRPIQHRDVKIENILINKYSSFVLCDFGSWSDV